MPPPRILAFAGSTRTASYNKKLIRVAARCARDAGADVTLIDLRDFPMPLYDGDLEEEHGLPTHARRLKALMKEHSGFLIAAPEYNSSITGVLKNAIDWASRSEPEEAPLTAFRGKIAGLIATSPGALGGLRTLVAVRGILTNLGVLVISEQRAIPSAAEAFDRSGALTNPNNHIAVANVATRLAEITARLTTTNQ